MKKFKFDEGFQPYHSPLPNLLEAEVGDGRAVGRLQHAHADLCMYVYIYIYIHIYIYIYIYIYISLYTLLYHRTSYHIKADQQREREEAVDQRPARRAENRGLSLVVFVDRIFKNS